jgi:hypothetical protein
MGDQRCKMINGFGAFCYHFDTIRSTRLMTDEHGKASRERRYSYDPFGNLRNAPNHTKPYLFTGKRWLNSIGTYDFRTKIYDPLAGSCTVIQRDMLMGSRAILHSQL